ncbi:MAG: gliding motility lipoprotein GldB [Bacteroidales bacterium]
MMRLFSWFLFFLAGGVMATTGCRRSGLDVNVSGIEAGVKVERFDRELFGMSTDTLDRAIGWFYKSYGDFFDVFNVHVINIGPASSRRYPAYLSMFVNDPVNREVFAYTNEVFASMEGINTQLSDGFSHYLYHYPDSLLPRVIGYVSRFNQGLFTVDHFVGVGLDQYLGSDCDYYVQMGTPKYLGRKKVPPRIPADVMYAWATQLFPFNDSVDNVLTRMIHQGLLTYFLDAMYPGMDDAMKLGFTEDQLTWCIRNEKQMWTHLVEEKLLFSTDPLVIRKLIEDAPSTSYYTPESPGRAAVWQGLQIVRAFASRQSRLTFPEVMAQRDYQELLRLSRYNP